MDAETLDAGRVGPWLDQVESALRGEAGSDVPCGTCTACCTSSQFVHVEPDEADTLAAIPAELLFPAPGLPQGHLLLGYDDRGHCPLLLDGRCSVYDHRPRACRVYDCRVFAAAGVEPDQPAVAAQVRRWRFTELDAQDRARHDALRAASAFLRTHPHLLPGPAGATGVAVLAVRLHGLFLDGEPDEEQVLQEISSRRAQAPSG